MTREEIIAAIPDVGNDGSLTTVLQNLETSGFVRRYVETGNARSLAQQGRAVATILEGVRGGVRYARGCRRERNCETERVFAIVVVHPLAF